MESLPDLVLPVAADLAADRSPAPPSEMEQCKARCTTSARRLQSWLESGTGARFRTFHPAAYQKMFADKYRSVLEDQGYTLTFEGDTLIISK